MLQSFDVLPRERFLNPASTGSHDKIGAGSLTTRLFDVLPVCYTELVECVTKTKYYSPKAGFDRLSLTIEIGSGTPF